MEMCIEPLSNLQEDVKNSVNNAKLGFEKCSKELHTRAYIETRLEYLEDQWKLFTDTHRTIITEIEVVDYRNSSYFKDQVYDATLEIYCNYKTALKESLDNIAGRTSSVSQSNSQPNNFSTMSEVKLPKITIPTFSGDYTGWTSFRDLFLSLIHNNVHLDNVQKLHYLKAHLAGEADQLLRHVSVTDANYDRAWELLNKRFNNRKYLSNCLLRRLISQPVITNESSEAIKHLLDTTDDCLNGLKNEGIDITSWDVILVYLISSKLDSESRKLWEAHISSSNDFPTINQFKEFLEQRFRSLEFLLLKPKHIPENVHVKVHHASTVVCPFCSQSHRLLNCKSFAAKPVETRRDFAKLNSLCYNCLVPGHSAYLCRQSSRCRKCNRKHHSLLHISISQSTAYNVKDSSVDFNSSYLSNEINNVKDFHSISQDQVLLPTALVNAESSAGTHIQLRCLLDQGSQASFISESAVKSLGLKKTPNKIQVSGVGDSDHTNVSKSMIQFSLQSIHDSNSKIYVKAHVLSQLNPIFPPKKVKNQRFPHLVNLQLADPHFQTSSRVDLLLGADIVSNILIEGLIKSSPDSPIAQNSVLGWVLSG